MKDKQIEDRWRGFARPISARNLSNFVEDDVVDALTLSPGPLDVGQRPHHAAGLAEGRSARRERQAAHPRGSAFEARGPGEEAIRVVGPRRVHEDQVAARQQRRLHHRPQAEVRALLGAAAACSAPAACPCARRAPLRLTGRPARADGGVRRARAAGPERAQAVQCGSVRGMSAAPRRAAAAATARWQWAAMMGAPLTGACSCEAGVREAAASVLGPCMSLGRGAPACQRRQSVRSARCWELVHLGALDDGSATHLLRHTGGRASARRSARTPPTAPIPQDHLRHAFGPARAAGAADLERATEARTAQRQPSGTDGCISSDPCIHRPAPIARGTSCPGHVLVPWAHSPIWSRQDPIFVSLIQIASYKR